MSSSALIIDDNPTNLDALSILLKREGMLAKTVQNPNLIAATLANMDDISIIFLDIEFPVHNGFTILKQLQQEERLQHVPIVAYSVHVSELNEARSAGFHSFIGKPLNVERFPNQLKRILSGVPVWEVV